MRTLTLAIVLAIAAGGAARLSAQDRPAPDVPPGPGARAGAPGTTSVTTTPDGFTVWRTDVNSGCLFGDHNYSIDVTAEPKDMKEITLKMTNFDVDYNAPQGCPGGPEVDPTFLNGKSLGILTGANNSWSINSFRLAQKDVVKGANAVKIDTDAPGTGCWCVGVGYVEIRAKVGFKIIKFTPQKDDKNRDFHAAKVDLTVTFSTEYDPATLTADTFKLEFRNAGGTYVPAAGTFAQLAPEKFRFVPNADLKDAVRYRVTVKGGASGVKSKAGATLDKSETWRFSTVPNLEVTDAFNYGSGSICPPATSPCPGLEVAVFQTSRNANLVTGKDSAARAYLRWKKPADVAAADQITSMDVEAMFKSGTSTGTLRKLAKRPDKYSAGDRKAARNTINYYGGKADASVEITPTPQTNSTPVKYKASKTLTDTGKSPRIQFDHYFLKDGTWAGGVPATAKSEVRALFPAGVQFTTDAFPVISTSYSSKGETSIGYTFTGKTVNDPDCGTVQEVSCPPGSKMAEVRCVISKLQTMRGGRTFVTGTAADGLCPGAAAFAAGTRVFIHQAATGTNNAAFSHEIGHIYGISTANNPSPGHRDNSDGVEGFQVRTKTNRSRIENPNASVSLMHEFVQTTGASWIHNDDYATLLGRGGAFLKAPLAANGYVIVSGTFDAGTNAVELFPAFLQDVPNDASDPAGTCTVALLDNADHVLSSAKVTPGVAILAAGSGPGTGPQLFEASLERFPNGRKVRVTCGTATATIAASAHAPSVTFTAPAAGATLTGTTTVSWSGSDTDPGTTLSYQLQISRDAGATWVPLTPLVTATQVELDTTVLESGTAQLRVLVTDGFDTSFATRSVTLNNSLTVQDLWPPVDALDVGITEPVSATFVSPLNPTTVTADAFTLLRTDLAEPVEAEITYDAAARTLTLKPAVALASSTVYTATLDTALRDTTGHALAADVSWSFTTAADTDPPHVVHRNPLPDAIDIPTNPLVTARFNEHMDPATITTTSFRLLGPGSAAVAATVEYNASNLQAVLLPSSALLPNSTYVVRVETGVKDLAGNPLEAADVWQFTTGDGPDPFPLRIVGTFSDRGIDTDGDGLFERLGIGVDVEVKNAGLYNLNARLADAEDALIEWQTVGNVPLDAGVYTLMLEYSAEAIRANGVNGPYTLDALNFYDASSNDQADVEFNAYRTFPYTIGQFYAVLAFGGLPDQLLEINTVKENAFNLRALTQHQTQPISDVTYKVLIDTNSALGVSIDSDTNVDIRPAANTEGEGDVTIEARDSIGNRVTATFHVSVQGARPSVLTPAFDDSVAPRQPQTINVTIRDQFGRIHTQSTTVTFSATAGTVAPAGVVTTTGSAGTTYTAPDAEGPAFLTIAAGDATTTITINVAGGGLSGDANGDRQVNVQDVFYLVNHLFKGGPAPVAPSDVNGDSAVNAADVIYLVNFLFTNGPAPQ